MRAPLMRAIVCDRLGDPSVLHIEERPIPEPGAGEIVVRVGAGSVNFPDVLMVAGGYQHKPDLPFVPGMEGAGTIHAIGADESGSKSPVSQPPSFSRSAPVGDGQNTIRNRFHVEACRKAVV